MPAGSAEPGPWLPGTRVPCTDDVLVRVARIPLPMVRRMVTDRVAERATAERVSRVDVAFFERAASF